MKKENNVLAVSSSQEFFLVGNSKGLIEKYYFDQEKQRQFQNSQKEKREEEKEKVDGETRQGNLLGKGEKQRDENLKFYQNIFHMDWNELIQHY